MGGARSSKGGVSDRHAADTSSIPQCGKGFFLPEETSSADSLTVSVQPCVQLYALTYVHMLKILSSKSTVRWIMETLQHPACTIRWAARFSVTTGFPQGKQPEFPATLSNVWHGCTEQRWWKSCMAAAKAWRRQQTADFFHNNWASALDSITWEIQIQKKKKKKLDHKSTKTMLQVFFVVFFIPILLLRPLKLVQDPL